MGRIMDRLLHMRTLRRWRRFARSAKSSDLTTLRVRRNHARQLRSHLDAVIHEADGQLALPRIGTSFFPTPHGTDWSWRPELWRGPLPVLGLSSVPTKSKLGDEVTLFHDCDFSELTLRQLN